MSDGSGRGSRPSICGKVRQVICVLAEARAEAEDLDSSSCCKAVRLRWRAKRELGGGEPFHDVHGSAADRAVPK